MHEPFRDAPCKVEEDEVARLLRDPPRELAERMEQSLGERGLTTDGIEQRRSVERNENGPSVVADAERGDSAHRGKLTERLGGSKCGEQPSRFHHPTKPTP